jgi:hypothetical protein
MHGARDLCRAIKSLSIAIDIFSGDGTWLAPHPASGDCAGWGGA